jgi:hypothetical protein
MHLQKRGVYAMSDKILPQTEAHPPKEEGRPLTEIVSREEL